MDPPIDDHDDASAIFLATGSCRKVLEDCTNIESLMKDDWAENRLMDFDLWAAGAGALAEPAVRLDQRLASQPHVRIVVLSLLSTIEAYAEVCRNLGKGFGHHPL